MTVREQMEARYIRESRIKAAVWDAVELSAYIVMGFLMLAIFAV